MWAARNAGNPQFVNQAADGVTTISAIRGLFRRSVNSPNKDDNEEMPMILTSSA